MKVFTSKDLGRRALIGEAARALRRGRVIIFPTDTIYGVVGDASRERVLRKIFAIKKRLQGKPFPILVLTVGEARRYAKISSGVARLLKRYWPGPTTLILPYRRGLAPSAVSPEGAAALRVPNNSLARELLARARRPLAATSVNISGHPYENEPRDMRRLFRRRKFRPDCLFDFGLLPRRKPSRIIDLMTPLPKVARR